MRCKWCGTSRKKWVPTLSEDKATVEWKCRCGKTETHAAGQWPDGRPMRTEARMDAVLAMYRVVSAAEAMFTEEKVENMSTDLVLAVSGWRRYVEGQR